MRETAITTYVIIGFMILSLGFAYAEEPAMPRVDQQFSLAKEQRINQLENQSLRAVFETFGSPEFFDEDDYLNKAIFRAFNFRAVEAVEFALGHVRSKGTHDRAEAGRKLYIAKRILQVFPDDALDRLLDLYNSGGPKIRANVIYVVGQMAGGQAIRTLLIEALYDTSICQDVLPDTVGEPLRICDVAYNQLVIRYKIKNVLRTIGSVHRIEVRDYHIQQLQSRL